jgi:hypothetical protein
MKNLKWEMENVLQNDDWLSAAHAEDYTIHHSPFTITAKCPLS